MVKEWHPKREDLPVIEEFLENSETELNGVIGLPVRANIYHIVRTTNMVIKDYLDQEKRGYMAWEEISPTIGASFVALGRYFNLIRYYEDFRQAEYRDGGLFSMTNPGILAIAKELNCNKLEHLFYIHQALRIFEKEDLEEYLRDTRIEA